MDSECVSVLPRVCELLAASGSSLPDDTSLEKLLDWFTALTKAGVSLVAGCPGLLEFVSTVLYNTASDPSILSFALKLTGLMAATEAGFTLLQECSMLDLVFDPQRWQEAGLWEDPCIRIGWVQGLKTMLQHAKALSFFVQADFIEPLLQLLTDASLFVTAAAGQMIAHILLFTQPVSSLGCNGTDKKEEDDRGTGSFISDLKSSTVTVETTQDRPAVVTVISEYLRKFLLPKELSQCHQSQKILKLLSLVLAQARSPLKEKLFLTVADSLEELVTKNYSQLTLPLVDVILVAHRNCGNDGHVPDRRADHLLSLMLNTGKPADLINAAAAFLRHGLNDRVHMAQSARILLLPLDVITGLTLLGTNASADEHWFSVVEQLKNKNSCISIICVSLTHTPQAALMAPDCLPCPPVLIVNAVMAVLRMCIGDSSSLTTGCAEAFRNVTNSGKCQKCALEALSSLSTGPEVRVLLIEVLTLLIKYLDSPDSDPTVLQKSYQALLRWISVCTDLSSITEQLRQDLIQVVRKRACDMRWEVRDSTVEFLGHLAGVRACPTSDGEACDPSEFLLGGRCFTTPLLKEALQDPESYVRASSISALARTLVHCWHQGTVLTKEQTEIVNQLLNILSEDTEGFARRAVVQYFIAWFSSSSSPSSSSLLMQSVHSVLSQGSLDLDWEVKVHTLDLAELLMDQAFSGHHGYTKGLETHPVQQHPYAVTAKQDYTLHTHAGTNTQDVEASLLSALSSLVEQGVLSALLCGLVDCDRPVGLKACRLLLRLRDTVCPLLFRVRDAAGATHTSVSCELPGQGWAKEIMNILGMKKKSSHADTVPQRCFHEDDVVNSDDCGDSAEEGEASRDHVVRVSVCEVLSSLGLDERLDILTESSDHIHNSPLSLLQDILTASAAHAHSKSQPEQEVIVDCY